MNIPQFDFRGVLPVGTFPATLAELRESHLVIGEGQPDWDRTWRAQLVDSAEVLIRQLWSIGITEVFIDGSFIEAKPRPNDIDGCGTSTRRTLPALPRTYVRNR